MARVKVDYDTGTGAIKVSIDGVTVEKVSEVLFYVYGEDNDIGSVEIQQWEYLEDKKMMKSTKITGSEKPIIVVQEAESETIKDIVKALVKSPK